MIGHNHIGKNGRFGNQMFQYAATRGIAAARVINLLFQTFQSLMLNFMMKRININSSWHSRCLAL